MDEHPGVVPAAVLDAEPVAHAEPLTDEQLNQQISDTLPILEAMGYEAFAASAHEEADRNSCPSSSRARQARAACCRCSGSTARMSAI